MATTAPPMPKVIPPRKLRDLPIWAQRIYLVLLALSDAETGLCPQHTESAGQRGLALILSEQLGGGVVWYETQVMRLVEMGAITRRENRLYLRVISVSLRLPHPCPACGLISDKRSPDVVCSGCHRSGWTREDRRWRVEAIQMAVMGKSPAAISARLGLPLWRIEDHDEAESMSLRRDEASGIVPHLYKHGLLDKEWEEAWAERDPVGYRDRERIPAAPKRRK